MNIIPLHDLVLVRPIKAEEQTAGGVYLPESTRELPQRAEVVSVGPGRITEYGASIQVDLIPGDLVLYSKYGATEIQVNGEDLLLLPYKEITATVDD